MLAVKAFIFGVAGSSLREADFSVHFIVFVNSLYRIIIIKTISWLLFQIWKKSVLDPVTQLTRNNLCGNRIVMTDQNCNKLLPGITISVIAISVDN